MLSIINALRAVLLVVIFTIAGATTCFANTETAEISIPPSGGMSAMKNIETDTRLYIFAEFKSGKSITRSDELTMDPKMNFPKELVGIKNIEEFPALLSAFQKYQQGYSVEFTPDMLHKKTEQPQATPEVVDVIVPIKIPVISLVAKEDLSFEIKSMPDSTNIAGIITIKDKSGKIITELKNPPYKWIANEQTPKGNYLAEGTIIFEGQAVISTPVPIVVNEKTIVTKQDSNNYPKWITVNNLLITTVTLFVLILYFLFYKAILPNIKWLIKLNHRLN